MRKVYLKRDEPKPHGTFGHLSTGTFECYTVENTELIIPPGQYRFYWRKDSPAHGECYEAELVPGRTNIQIHSANWADQLLGCIAPGAAIMDVKRKDGSMLEGVTSSRDTTARLVADLGKCSFDMVVT